VKKSYSTYLNDKNIKTLRKTNDNESQNGNLSNDLTLNISVNNFDNIDIIDYDLTDDYTPNTSDNEK